MSTVHASPAEWRPVPLPRVPAPGAREFARRFERENEPVVLTGVADGWPALRWSPEHLRGAHGSLEVRAYVMREGRIVLDAQTGFRVEEMRMDEYAERAMARAEPTHYLRARLDTLPELAREVRTPPYADGRLGLRSNLWFAMEGTVSQLHFDLPHNLVVQLHGRKRFILFSDRDSRSVYPHSFRSSTPHLSRVDPEAPDLERFPRLRRARPLECVLEPGDALFIPRRFWHHARALTPSISTNFWWCDPLTYPVLLASDLYKRVRGLNI